MNWADWVVPLVYLVPLTLVATYVQRRWDRITQRRDMNRQERRAAKDAQDLVVSGSPVLLTAWLASRAALFMLWLIYIGTVLNAIYAWPGLRPYFGIFIAAGSLPLLGSLARTLGRISNIYALARREVGEALPVVDGSPNEE